MAGKSRGRSKVLQILGSWAPKIGMSKHRSRKREERKRKGSMYGQATKGVAGEKTSTSHMGKGIEVL